MHIANLLKCLNIIRTTLILILEFIFIDFAIELNAYLYILKKMYKFAGINRIVFQWSKLFAMYDETRPSDISILLYRTKSDIDKKAVTKVQKGDIELLPKNSM